MLAGIAEWAIQGKQQAAAVLALCMLAFETLSDQCAGLLLHGIRREGGLSSHTADALNVLGKPQVVERYRAYGNRWSFEFRGELAWA